jgi:Peptidase family S41
MFKKAIVAAVLVPCVCYPALGQTPSPTPKPVASVGAKTLIDSLAPAEIDETIRVLKSNFIDPNALKDQEINRATLEGLLARLHGGAILLPNKDSESINVPAPFYSEVLNNHIGYVRIGSLTADNLRELDKALASFATRKVDAMVIDLRASTWNSDFDVAAEMTKRFIPKEKTLWTLHKTAARQDRTLTNDRDPSFQGLTTVLVDGETAGAAEAIAVALKLHARALLIGQPTAGRAVEYSDFPLASGKTLRVAVEEVIGADGHSLFPDGVKPDLPVETPPAQKRQIFVLSAQRGIAAFVFETERPHFNEAALIAGTNPELEARQQRRNSDENLHDAVLQRAVDVIASIAVFQRR